MSHLMEEVLHHAGSEQGGGALGGLGQAQHQHHNRQLVLTRFLAPPATADGEVTVLGGRGGGEARGDVIKKIPQVYITDCDCAFSFLVCFS